MHVVFLRTAYGRAAIAVDEVRDRGEVVTRPLGPQLASIPWLIGACITGTERPVLILDVERVRASVDARCSSLPTEDSQGGASPALAPRSPHSN